MIFRIIGSILNLVHERIGLSYKIFDADELFIVFFIEDALLLRMLILLELSVPNHRFLDKL